MIKKYTCKDDILLPLIKRTQSLIRDDFNISILDSSVDIYCPNRLDLKEYTAMVGTGGALSIIFAVSYENSILDKLVNIFMLGDEINPSEVEEIKHSVAGEIANTIIGNALAFFPHKGKGITITPPITIAEAKSILKYKDSKIATSLVHTSFGEISINVIGPRLLFLNEFDFKE